MFIYLFVCMFVGMDSFRERDFNPKIVCKFDQLDSIYVYCVYTVQYVKERLTPKLSADLSN